MCAPACLDLGINLNLLLFGERFLFLASSMMFLDIGLSHFKVCSTFPPLINGFLYSPLFTLFKERKLSYLLAEQSSADCGNLV